VGLEIVYTNEEQEQAILLEERIKALEDVLIDLLI
jgi:hypothetical protein